MTPLQNLLARLESVSRKATEGPWDVACESGDWFLTHNDYADVVSIEDNIDYIANMNPKTTLALLAMLKEAYGALYAIGCDDWVVGECMVAPYKGWDEKDIANDAFFKLDKMAEQIEGENK